MDAPTRTIGVIGLGKMGLGIARRLHSRGYTVTGADPDPDATTHAAASGIGVHPSLRDMVEALDAPRTVWIMVPAGAATDAVIHEVAAHLDAGDLLIDGGNSNYRDSVKRADEMAALGIHFLDAGTSGGIAGERNGFCIMVGGPQEAVERAADLFDSLGRDGRAGWAHVGKSGAGHFVKMIHNGIEYGMMQALAEGFALLEARSDLASDLAGIAELWRHGSIVSSTLLDHVAGALAADAGLTTVAPYVGDSGEGRWTVQEAVDLSVPAPIITMSLLQRFRSRVDDSFADRLLAAMRLGFGGHQPGRP